MKAIIRTGPRSVGTREREVLTPGADELLTEVHTAGLCGSDAHACKYDDGYEWIPTPQVMGHGYSGTVMGVGANARTLEVDDKVVEEPIHDRDRCFQCRNGRPNVYRNFSTTRMHRDGVYMKYVTVTPEYVHAAPEGVPFRHVAITKPANIAAHVVLDQSVTMSDNNILVKGSDPIGVLITAVTDSSGANVTIFGLSQNAAHHLPLLGNLGIDTVNLEEEGGLDGRIKSQTDGTGFDMVFDAAGHHSGVVSGNDVVRKGSQIVAVGIPNLANELGFVSAVRDEVDISTSYGSTWTNFEQALRLMEHGGIAAEKILDTPYSVDDPAVAFEAFLGSEICKPVSQFDG